MEKRKVRPTLTKGVAKVPVVMQLEALECGAAALCMVMACAVLGESFYLVADGMVAPCQGMCDCDFGKNFPTLKEKPLREILTDSDYVKYSYTSVGDVRRGNDECRKCEYIDRCAGSCRNSALMAGDNFYGVDPDACYFFKNGWEERIRAAAQLAFDEYIKRNPPKDEIDKSKCVLHSPSQLR